MQSPKLLRAFAVLAFILLLVPDSFAQRGGRSSGSSGRSSSGSRASSTRSSGSVRTSRPSISTSRSRPTYTAPRSTYTPRTSSRSTSIFSGSSRSTRSRGSYVAPSTSRGSTRFLPSTSRYGSTRSTNTGSSIITSRGTSRSSNDTRTSGNRGSSSVTPGSTYTPFTTNSGAHTYGNRGSTSRTDTSRGETPRPGDTGFGTGDSSRYGDAPSSRPSPRITFPRAYRPNATPDHRARPGASSQATGRRSGIDTTTTNSPRDVSDIAQRYRGSGSHGRPGLSGSMAPDRAAGPIRIAPGGRRGEGGSRYGDGPSGRLNPHSPESPTGRQASPTSRQVPSGRDSGSIGARGSDNTAPGGRIGDIGPTDSDVPASIAPHVTPTTDPGDVTPGGGSTLVPPTIVTPTFTGSGNKYYYANYSPFCYSPYYSWGWYAWYAPFYVSNWYWSSYYPSYYRSGVYVGYYDTPVVVDNRTIIIDSGYEVVGEGSVLYEGASDYEGGVVVGERSPEENMELTTAADSYLQLGDRAFRERRYGDAVHFYAKAIEFSPEEGALYLVLADALFATGDYHYAAYAIRRALEIDPTLIDADIDKHLFYGSPEDFDQQLRVLESYVRDHPTDNDSRLVLALNFLFGQRAAEAVRVLETQFSRPVSNDLAAELILQRARLAQ